MNGKLRAKVVGEGGNLGVTNVGPGGVRSQRRAHQHRRDGQLAGVDCSDHEVNIKILVDSSGQWGKVEPGNPPSS